MKKEDKIKMEGLMNNGLEREIQTILELSKELVKDYGGNSMFFSEPATQQIIDGWEYEYMAVIPKDYKEWLSFARFSVILFDLAIFEMPYEDRELVKEPDLFIIGRIVGDGELVCISIITGKVVRILNGNRKEYASFKEFLNKCIIKMLKNTLAKDGEKLLENEMMGQFEALNCRQIREKTRTFNALSVPERKEYLALLKSISDDAYDEFLEDIRRQAVLDYWQHERALLKQGQATRQWNPKQIEAIMNINTQTGSCEKEAGRPRG